MEEKFSSERIQAAAAARSEAESLKVRVNRLSSEVRELQHHVDERESKIQQLKLEIETARENEAKQVAYVTQLRHQLAEYEALHGNLEGAKQRGEIALSALQLETKESSQRILELERRNRILLSEKEELEQRNMVITRKYKEVANAIGMSFDIVESTYSSLSSENSNNIVLKATEMQEEINLLKGKVVTLQEYIRGADIESKANRETIQRLVSDVERKQESNSKQNHEFEIIRLERENFQTRAKELEKEVEILRERLESSQRVIAATKHEYTSHETRTISFERQQREMEITLRNSETNFRNFKQQIADWISDTSCIVEPYEESIRERIRVLMTISRERDILIEGLEKKVSNLTTQLESSFQIQRETDRRAAKAETELSSMQKRIMQAEGELAAADVLRDGLRSDKEKYLHFLEKISRSLKMDPINIDIGYDMSTDAILARAEQLVKLESDALIDRKTHIYNLQRKVKQLKEQLDSKDVHMELLRKKIASSEERLNGRTEIEREKDSEMMKNRKLCKLVERYKTELNEAHCQIRDLKASLLETKDFEVLLFSIESFSR